MRTRGINLLPDQHKLSPQALQMQRFNKNYLPIVLSVYICILVVIIGTSFYFTHEVQGVEGRIAIEENTIRSLNRNEGIYLFLKQKLGALNTIFASRYPYIDTMNFFKTLTDQSEEITGFDLTETGLVVVNAKVGNSAALDALVTRLLEAGSKQFSVITLESIQYKPASNFEITLSVVP